MSPRRSCLIVLQGPKASSWRVLSALCMWFTHQRGRSSLWAVGCAEMPTPSKITEKETFTENQFVYCDFWLLLKLSHEAWLWQCQVSWTLDQDSALSQESSGLLLYQHQYPCPAVNMSGGLLWIPSNLKQKRTIGLKKEKRKKKKITCDVFACGRCIPSASIDVAHLLITEV